MGCFGYGQNIYQEKRGKARFHRAYYFDIRNKNLEIHVLKEENTKLRIALCNLRDEYLDMGGDPNQLELFDKDNPSQLNIFNEEA